MLGCPGGIVQKLVNVYTYEVCTDFHGKPFSKLRGITAIWDHKELPATRYKVNVPRLNPFVTAAYPSPILA